MKQIERIIGEEKKMSQKEKISIIGLGKLGSTMLACFAHKKWDVIGVDINQSFVDIINKGHSPIYEPQVEELINLNDKRITATSETEFAVLHSDVSFIIVPTPSIGDGSFSTLYIEEAVSEIADALSKKDSYHVFVITSTVLPGDTARIAGMLAEQSGKELGKDFGVCYNPDFIALGKIVHDFLNPDMILIGESDERAGSIVESIHRRLADNNPPIYRMNFYNAELSKVTLNAYCTLKITFANSIAEICEKMPEGDSDVVLQAVGSDTRVGHKYFKGGLGFAGPCLLSNALVQTDRGLKEIQDVKIDDRVFTHKGHLRKVTQTYRRKYLGSMKKIISSDFPYSSIISTPEHPVWGSKRNQRTKNKKKLDFRADFNGLEFIPAFKMKQGDLTALPVIKDSIEILPEKTSKRSKSVWIEKDNMLSIIKSVEEEFYEGYVYNLEVEEDNSYMLESGVVHNCFPRDNRALSYTARRYGVYETFCDTTDEINEFHKTERICHLLMKYLKERDTDQLAILGLSYKEDTPVVEESVSIAAVKELSKRGVKLSLYDPAAMESAEDELKDVNNITYATSEYDCVKGKSVCFIATPWKQFYDLEVRKLLEVMESDSVILDAWRVLPFERASTEEKDKVIVVRRIGKNLVDK